MEHVYRLIKHVWWIVKTVMIPMAAVHVRKPVQMDATDLAHVYVMSPAITAAIRPEKSAVLLPARMDATATVNVPVQKMNPEDHA